MAGLQAVGNSLTVSIGRLEASNRIIGEIQEAKAGQRQLLAHRQESK